MKHIQTKNWDIHKRNGKILFFSLLLALSMHQNRFYGEYVKLGIAPKDFILIFKAPEKAHLSVLDPTSFLIFSQFQKLLLQLLQDFVTQMER